MKKILLILFVLPIMANCTTHYVSLLGSGSGSNGLTPSTAWSYPFYNVQFINPGDTVNFNKGDVFSGFMNVSNGSAGNNIIYGTYGTGANPKFTGLITLSNWVNQGGNIWMDSTAINAPITLNVVTVDGNLVGMGRYPKSGYITYMHDPGSSNSNSFYASQTIPFDPYASEAVIRKIRQVTDRQHVTYYQPQSNNLFGLDTYNYGGFFANNTAYSPNDNMGFFLQNALRYVTADKDWYYNNNRLYMYFADNNPSAHVVKVAAVQNLIASNNFNYVSFQNIDFEGANNDAFLTNGISNISFLNCNFSFCGNGLWCTNGTNHFYVKKCGFSNIVNNGIFIVQSVNNIIIDSCSLYNIGTIQGMGGSGDGQQLGMWIIGDTITISNNNLRNIGYHGIVFDGNLNAIKTNTIDSFALSKDDAGAIYSFQFSGVTTATNTISNNVVTNGIGLPAGAPSYQQIGFASGIYLDDNSNHNTVKGNTIKNMPYGGLFIIDNNKDSIAGNTICNSNKQAYFAYYTTAMDSIFMVGNTFQNKTGQTGIYVENHVSNTPNYLATDNNVFLKGYPVSVENQFSGGSGVTNYSLSQWQTNFVKDINSLNYINNNRSVLINRTNGIRLINKN